MYVGVATVVAAAGLALAVAVLLQSALLFLICLTIAVSTAYFLFIRLYQKRRTQYPIVPPEGKMDIYFPRTNIPRPIHEDLRKTQKKRRQLTKIEKLRRKKQ